MTDNGSEALTPHPRLIFLHIPKTGGTTLTSVFSNRFEPEETFDVHEDNDRPFASYRDMLQRVKDLPDQRAARIKFLHGHVPYGVHQSLPGSSTYVTMLRDPVDRVLSQYYFWKKTSFQPILDEDLPTFARNLVGHKLDNYQVRLISGAWDHQGPCSQELLEKAIYNLRNHFVSVGLTERFGESLLHLRKRLGWRSNPYYIKRNVARRRPGRDRIPQNVLAIIEEHNQLDMKLYEYVFTAFEKTSAELHIHWAAVKFYGLQLYIYQRLYPIEWSLNKLSSFWKYSVQS